MTESQPESGHERKPEWLTVAEVAEVVRVSEDAVRRRIARGTIPARLLQEFDGGYRIHRSMVYPAPRTKPTLPESAPPEITRTVPVEPVAVPAPAQIESRQPATALASTSKQLIATVVVLAALLWVSFSDIGSNPAGLFSDEAEIALSTLELFDKPITEFRPQLFYDHFDYHHLGALPLFASAPVLAFAPLDDWSVRIVSAIWSLLAVVMLVLTVRRLGWRHGEIAVIGFALTPVFIHFSRIQFAHAPSLFCTAAAYYAYVRSREGKSWKWALGSGLLFGAAMYGQAAWYIASPLLIGGLLLGELIVNRLTWHSYKRPLLVVAGFATTCIPVLIRYATDDKFMKRFEEKDRETPPVPFAERIGDILGQYDKYFSLDYLFRVGETGMPGGWNMRHSVPGSGELTWILLPLMLAGVIGIFRISDPTSRVIGIGALVALILYPAAGRHHDNRAGPALHLLDIRNDDLRPVALRPGHPLAGRRAAEADGPPPALGELDPARRNAHNHPGRRIPVLDRTLPQLPQRLGRVLRLAVRPRTLDRSLQGQPRLRPLRPRWRLQQRLRLPRFLHAR